MRKNKDLVEDRSKYPLWVQVVLKVFQCWLVVYDAIVYIPFMLFANPKDKVHKSNRIKAEKLKDEPVWRNVDAKYGLSTGFYPDCSTLDQVWERSVTLHGDLNCMGSRQILSVEKELQPNGKTFEKFVLADYDWETYAEVAERVDSIGSGILASGHKTGDRVVIFAETRAEWMMTALACFKYGFPVVTVYSTLGEDAIAHALNETEAVTVFTSQDLVAKIVKIIPFCNDLQRLVYYASPLPGVEPLEEDAFTLTRKFQIMSFGDLLDIGDEKSLERERIPTAEDIAVIMYTSGTTGLPKGVMILHKNLVAATHAQSSMIPGLGTEDRFIAYLPLAHVLEVAAEFACYSTGVAVGYSSALTMTDNGSKIKRGTPGDCSVLRPTLIAAVPAIMDRIYKTVIDKVKNSNPMRQALFHLLYERKRSKIQEGYNSPFMNRLVFSHIRSILGSPRMILSGGAPLNAETERFMNICFCCPVGQGYGLTETCGAGTICPADDLSTGRVGPPLTCNDIILRDWTEAGYQTTNKPHPQGEILLSGANIVTGYLKNPEKTAEDFIEWNGRRCFATGDIGEIHEDGSLKIIDRKKDLLKLSHGEYVSLARVETQIGSSPLIDNICIYGNSFQSFLIALVVPNLKNLRALAKEIGVEDGELKSLCENEALTAAFLKQLQQHAAKEKLEKFEIPLKLHLCHEIWTPSMDLLTEALKLKRRPIEAKYKDIIQKLYE